MKIYDYAINMLSEYAIRLRILIKNEARKFRVAIPWIHRQNPCQKCGFQLIELKHEGLGWMWQGMWQGEKHGMSWILSWNVMDIEFQTSQTSIIKPSNGTKDRHRPLSIPESSAIHQMSQMSIVSAR